MSSRVAMRLAIVTVLVALAAPAAVGYIHYPPMTVPRMCKESHQIRVLKVAKYDKEKGVIAFELTTSLKGEKSRITSFKHAIRTDAEGVKPILDWLAEGKTAVMFSIESKTDGPPKALGYVFIHKYCYSVDYYDDGKYWLLVRAEPGLSSCFHGSAEQLQEAVTATLAGKEVKVPVKDPERKEDFDKRYKEVNDIIKKNK